MKSPPKRLLSSREYFSSPFFQFFTMHIPHQAHLSYCTNIHAGESWPEVFRSLEEYCLPLKRSLNPDTPFGIGLRLSNESSLVLAQSEELDRFKNWLQEHDLYVFTMNGFPYGAFHFARVKENVHRPDWTTSDRLTYSKRLFDILAELLPEGLDGGVSTSPISYKHWYATPIELAKAKEMATTNMIDLAAHLILLKERTGKSLHLDIEPEPDGILEDSQGFIQFYQDYLLARGIPRLSKKLGLAASDAEAAIREHLQMCYDVCHFAVGFESPREVISTMHNLGIQIGKIQISAALKASLPEAPEEREAIHYALLPFDESTYLHQVTMQKSNGHLDQFADLKEGLHQMNRQEYQELRTHFHVPIFADSYGVLQSTQDQIIETLRVWRETGFSKHLEVETYTWEVLPTGLKLGLKDSIEREIRWVQDQL
ncbi:MAG: metabolite traffic protein EboE [Bacteroidota bacterium]